MNCCFQIFQTFLVLDQISRGQTSVFPLCRRPWLQIHLCLFSHSTKCVACRYHQPFTVLLHYPPRCLRSTAMLPQASLQNQSIHKKIHKIWNNFTRFKTFCRTLQFYLKWLSYLLYHPKTFASFASLLKNRSCWSLENVMPTILRGWKRHYTRSILDQSA